MKTIRLLSGGLVATLLASPVLADDRLQQVIADPDRPEVMSNGIRFVILTKR